MSAEVERFANDVKSNTELQEAAKGAGTDVGALVAVANEHGYKFTADELNAHAATKKSELSEEELEQVAGGSNVITVVVVGVTVVAT